MDYCTPVSCTNANEEKQQTCLICHEDYLTASALVQITDCSHIYHTSCIKKWFEYNESCPICRKSLTPQLSLVQYLLLFLSFSPPTSPRSNGSDLQTHDYLSLTQSAFTATFLHVILDRFKTSVEYNAVKEPLLNAHRSMAIDGAKLPENLNIRSRTAALRELKHCQVLLRSQLIQCLWTQTDPYHMNDPPRVNHGRRMFSHPYLQNWKRKIEAEINGFL